MTFIIIAIMHILTATICTIFINAKWKYYIGDKYFPPIKMLRMYNTLSRVWPSDDGFLSLKFSAIRHAVIPMIFSALIWFVDIGWLNSILTFLALYYVWAPISRYRVRKADYEEAGEVNQKMLIPVKSACFSVIICAVANYIILLICYALHP